MLQNIVKYSDYVVIISVISYIFNNEHDLGIYF